MPKDRDQTVGKSDLARIFAMNLNQFSLIGYIFETTAN